MSGKQTQNTSAADRHAVLSRIGTAGQRPRPAVDLDELSAAQGFAHPLDVMALLLQPLGSCSGNALLDSNDALFVEIPRKIERLLNVHPIDEPVDRNGEMPHRLIGPAHHPETVADLPLQSDHARHERMERTLAGPDAIGMAGIGHET